MREIDGRTRTCGLIGDPVEHTLSPLIHNTLARELGHNLVYVPLRVEGGSVEDAVKGAYALNLLGMNVTVPHKSAVIPFLKRTDELAARIGAVNTLVRCEGGYKGYNTDMTGLYRAMVSEGIRLEDREIILLGAGGAARAVAFLCALRGAARVYLLNRTIQKAEAVAGEVNRAAGRECVIPYRMEDYGNLPKGRYLAIQGTSAGLYPHVEDAPVLAPDFYRRVHTGYDLIYRPARTRFMRLVEEAGGKSFNGLKMLLYQGIEAYELWNGVHIEDSLAEVVYKRMKEELGTYE